MFSLERLRFWRRAFLARSIPRSPQFRRVGGANRTFGKFPEQGRTMDRMEPDPGSFLATPQRAGALAATWSKMQGVRCPLRGIRLKRFPPNSRAREQRDKKTTDLPEGEYLCKWFAETTFQKAGSTILFLLLVGEDGEPKTHKETPTLGFFLEKEIDAIGGHMALEKRESPLRCRLRGEKTTPAKKKCGRVALA